MRTIQEIAFEITSNWEVINNKGACEALRHMREMRYITSPYGADTQGHSIIGTFLVNSVGWRGEVARRIKKELRDMCSQHGH